MNPPSEPGRLAIVASHPANLRWRVLACATLLFTQACQPQTPGAPEDLGGLFTAAEAAELHENWDYVTGWFGGDLTRYANLNIHRLYPLAEVRRGGAIRELAEAPRLDVAEYVVNTSDRGRIALDDYVATDPRIDGFVVLQGGEIVYERYVNMRPDDRHIYFSISKMITGLLLSKFQDRGLIDVTQTLDHYIPDLIGTAWEGVTIRNVLDMASGIGCYENNEAYADITSCFMVMEGSLGFQPERPPVSFRSHIATAPTGYEQGIRRDYTSANTNMLMYLAEVVTGQTYPDLVSDLIWQEVGAEEHAMMVAGDRDVGQAAAAHAGLFTTLRDLGRFGLFMLEQTDFHRKLLDDARPELVQPDDAERAAYETAGELPTHAVWQLDVVFADGDFGKFGFAGQYLYVSPRNDLVVAWFGSFGEDMATPDLASVARQLASSPLWQ